jgi:hypothetical protein
MVFMGFYLQLCWWGALQAQEIVARLRQASARRVVEDWECHQPDAGCAGQAVEEAFFCEKALEQLS